MEVLGVTTATRDEAAISASGLKTPTVAHQIATLTRIIRVTFARDRSELLGHKVREVLDAK